eukprot:4399425-Amphidinium_carterae.1
MGNQLSVRGGKCLSFRSTRGGVPGRTPWRSPSLGPSPNIPPRALTPGAASPRRPSSRGVLLRWQNNRARKWWWFPIVNSTPRASLPALL